MKPKTHRLSVPRKTKSPEGAIFDSPANRPGHDEYFMRIAMAVRERADCKGQKVGAVIVKDDRIISTGYNGTPAKLSNCSEGGCVRCVNRGKKYATGTAYDLCICVHAEQNAVLSAARFGISVQGSTLYTTTQPCFGCLKELLQAGVSVVHFVHHWSSPRDEAQQQQYDKLMDHFEVGVFKMEIVDPRKDWAVPTSLSMAKSVDEHGMETQ
jgi:dCMP deaminase